MLLDRIRQFSFWVLDFLKGSSLKKNLKDIRFINENYFHPQTEKKRNIYLNNILNHSIKNVNFYNKLNPNSTLENFPVINKNIIIDNYSNFQAKNYKSKLYKVSTSGSTGTPFTTYLSKNKRDRNISDTIYFAKKSGFNLGDKLVYIRLWDKQHGKSKFGQWIQNVLPHDISELSDDDIQQLLNKMKRSNSAKGILAYASAYDTIGQYLDKKNLSLTDYNVRSIVAISEGLNDYAKSSIKKHFGLVPVSRYSAVETGIVAQQNVHSEHYTINWASYFIEILNLNNDEPVGHGKVGRIVITDLFNYAVPMIRYDTGDVGVMVLTEDNIPVLSRVEGRKMDMLYDTNKVLLSSHIVHKICLFKGIRQYQLIQEGEKEYRFKICVTSEFNDELELVKVYKDYLGQDAIIEVEYVTDVPLLSSGKRKKVLNLHHN
jgi:phenylacetate-CoA ligase